MNKKKTIILSLLLACFMLGTVAAEEIVVHSPNIALINETFIVNVSVSNMNEVCGYSFDLFFNTSVVNGISINRSELFINSCTKTFWDSSIPTPGIDSSTGVIAYYDGCWGRGNETVTGNDVVSFTFKALFPGINYL